MASRVKVYFDGGCRPNPGAMEIAVVIGGREYVRRDLGQGSSMNAEWLALIEALTLVRSLDLKNFILLGDAAAVIRQAQGAAKSPRTAHDHLGRFHALAGATAPLRIRYIKRAQNLAGIALARLHPR